MPNVGFKLGSQENMDKIVNTVVAGSHGTFYLTSDTSRLYVGNADNKIVPVNAGIITVAKVDALPAIPTTEKEKQYLAGNYYYAKEENILCVFNGQHWVQINSVVTNTGLTTDLTAVTGGVSVETGVASSAGTVNDSYTIKGDKGISVAIDPENGDVMTIAPTTPITVTAAAGSNNKSAAVKVASSLATNNEQSFNIVGGDHVTSVGVSGNDITINVQDTVNTGLETAVAANGTNNVKVTTTVTQTPGDNVTDDYTISSANGITVTAGTDNIAIGAQVIKTQVAAATKGATVTLAESGLVDANNKDFSIVSGDDVVTVAADGKNIKITAIDTKNTGMAVENHATSGFEFSVSQTPGDKVTAQFDPVITIGKEGDVSDVKFSGGKAALNVYTVAQTDKLIEDELKLFNSMTYRGTRTAAQGLPASGVHIGDTYLINSDNFPYDGNTYPKGTLAIARGIEDAATGEITGTIEWDFVTGSQVDTQYAMKAITGGIKLFENGTTDRGQLVIKGDSQDASTDTSDDIIVSDGVSEGANQELIVQHKKYAATTVNTAGDSTATMDELQQDFEILAVDSITTSNGHITGFTTKKYTVKDTNASLDSYAIAASTQTADKVVSLTHTVTLAPAVGDKQSKEASLQIESLNDNLHVNASGSSVQMNLVWGTF